MAAFNYYFSINFVLKKLGKAISFLLHPPHVLTCLFRGLTGTASTDRPLFFCWLDLVAAILNLNFISATQKKTVNEGLRGLWVKLAAGFHHCYYYYYVTAHSCSLNTAHRFRYVSIRTVRLTALYRCVSSTWQMLNWPHQTGGVKKRRKGNEGKIRWKLTKKQAERF